MSKSESEPHMHVPDARREQFNEIAKRNFEAWNGALATGNPNEVAKLYAEGSTFLPTLSPEFKHSTEATVEYFSEFQKKNPVGAIREEIVQPLGDRRYLHSGLYDFMIDAKEGRQVVEARFTFLWEQDETGVWKIIHHHSSLRPQSAH